MLRSKVITSIGSFLLVFMILVTQISCKSTNNTTKGGAIGAGAGGVIGGLIGHHSGNTVVGAIIGAAVGGTAGAVIGRQMDKQAAEIAKDLEDAEVIREGEAIVINFKEKVLFGYDRSDLNGTAQANLDKLNAILLKYPETTITVIGHTDSKGSDDYNQTLSESRANAVTNYSSKHGVGSSRLTAIGKGESDPVASNATQDGSALNRRVEFTILKN